MKPYLKAGMELNFQNSAKKVLNTKRRNKKCGIPNFYYYRKMSLVFEFLKIQQTLKA